MVQKTQRYSKRSDQEWLDLIQECRSSGMTDKEWCDQHQIHRSKFYYHIRRLRKKACSIPGSTGSVIQAKQEVVQIQLQTPEPVSGQVPVMDQTLKCAGETAIRMIFHDFHMEITNAAAGETIINTIAALQKLC